MLISEKVNAEFNRQIGHELAVANQYLAIAAYFDREGLIGLAKSYYKQADEERDHAMKFIKFIHDAGGEVKIPAIPEPRNNIGSALEAAQLAYDAEVETTKEIYALVELATEEKSHIARNFLQWFLEEQLEEVSSAETRLSIIRRAGPSIMMVEAYLAHHGV